MPKSIKSAQPLVELLNVSERPIYAVDADRRIVYCNPALAAWLELDSKRIVGRLVEYHSEPEAEDESPRELAGPLAGLCPPPRALAGEAATGTASCLARDGRLIHRRADFVPLHVGVLALLAETNLSPHELSAEFSAETATDDLHRAIRRFRRAQVGRYAIETLLGKSTAMQKVRSQVVAAAASGANVLVSGRPGTGRARVARAIHYHAAGNTIGKLVPIDGATLTDNLLRRAIDSAGAATEASRRPTLLIEQAELVSASHQSQLVEALQRGALAARLIATTCEQASPSEFFDHADDSPAPLLQPALHDIVSTITIQLPRLVDRLDDLPILAQFFLEAANRGSSKQIGSMRPEALDLLALYGWPRELDELSEVITAAHREAATHTIGPADLPAVVHHAAKAAALLRRPREQIVLNDLLTTIEKEAIVRALAQSGGNKSEAAELLGLTRPRLYRRMEQLGLAPAEASEPSPKFKELPLPDFREVAPEEPGL
jgi:transcriptional regulator with PAS, ATPase and Fis domain